LYVTCSSRDAGFKLRTYSCGINWVSHSHLAKRTDPAKLSTRAYRDIGLKPEIARVFAENFEVYGARKVWRQLKRERFDVARSTVERLMRSMGLLGVIRGKSVRTTINDKVAPCPPDRAKRQSNAPRPNTLWVSDFTYVSTWTGFICVAFVIDAYARRIVGLHVSRTAHAGCVLDVLEQALHQRRPVHRGGLIHHSDRGNQYVSIKCTERLTEAFIARSVGSVDDSSTLRWPRPSAATARLRSSIDADPGGRSKSSNSLHRNG
jgi:transposase InsO family protein